MTNNIFAARKACIVLDTTDRPARPYMSVRPSTKSFFDFNEIWYVGRGQRVMHDGMQYDPIQGQGQGHDSRAP